MSKAPRFSIADTLGEKLWLAQILERYQYNVSAVSVAVGCARSNLYKKRVAGSHVFVCDNLALSGSVFAFKRKNTTGLDFGSMIATGFDKFLLQAEAFDVQVARLQGTVISADRAKTVIYDIFAARVLPVRLFDDVNRFYFDADAETVPEVASNRGNVWGVHNAVTRAMRDLSPVRQFGATVALGRQLSIVDVD